MTRCSIEPRDQIFVREFVFLSFAKNTDNTLSGK